jgi:ABC-type glycerol-3-phosphate transport system permease component
MAERIAQVDNQGGRRASLAGETSTRRQPVVLVLRLLGGVLLYTLLILLAGIMIMPLVWMLSTASKPLGEATSVVFHLIPKEFTLWENITVAFGRQPFALYIYNSAIVAISITVGQVLISALAGYSFAKFRFPGRDLLFMGVLSTMMVPFFVVIIPLYIVVYSLGWLDTYWALIVPGLVSAFGIFLMRQFMTSIPDELIDAARIDGSHEVRTFFQIALPLAKPALSTLAILSFMGSWDGYVWPLMVINDRSMMTLPLGLTVFRSSYITYWNELMAMALIGVIPTFTIFFIFQRQFVEGVAITGLKG